MTKCFTSARFWRGFLTGAAPCTAPPLALGAALLFAPSLLAPSVALADVQVSGTPEAARVVAQGGSIDEVMAALRNAFEMRWQAPMPLDRRLTGTYEGSLNRVLTRVLEGYNFVVKAGNGRLEVIVLGARSGTAVAAAGTAAKPAASGAPPSMPAAPTIAKDFKEPPKMPAAAPVLAAATSKPIDDGAGAPVPNLTKLAEGPVLGPVPGQDAGNVTAPEPMPSTVAPPMPGPGTGAVPEITPSAALPPGPPPPVPQGEGAPGAPQGEAPPSGGLPPPAPPRG
ncbi:MAG: hypothetical protein ACJ8F3_01590 [Xanthobacteraceae bacterium]